MLKRATVIGCLVLLYASLAWSADRTFQMPADMQKLLPSDPVFIVAVSSVNDLERQWLAIREMLDEGNGEPTDLAPWISEELPQFAKYGDMDRPLAVAMDLPNLMGGEEPPITFIIPISDSFGDQAKLELEEEGLTYFIQGRYLAFSMDPAYAPAAVVPDLALDLSPGFITSRLDLEAVVSAYRPMAEMSLDAMANQPAPPDTSETGAISQEHGMEAQDAAAIGDMARSIMDSLRRLDLALQIEGETLTLHSGFSVFPDSPLDPGPQPSFEEALQLTRLLPTGGNIIQTMALDQTRQFEVFKDFYVVAMEKEIASLPPEQGEAYRAWFTSYLESIDLFVNPMAASIKMSEEGMSANLVMKCVDPAANLDRIAALFAGLTAADIGIGLKKMPTGKVTGVEVHSWTVKFDEEKLAEISNGPKSPQMSGIGRLEADQMIGFLRKVTPNINMAARGEHLILSADKDPANLAHMIQMSGQRRGAANPEIAAVAAKAGPACQQAVTGDLMAILSWVTEWMEEMEGEEIVTIENNPIPFSSSLTIDGPHYGGMWTMDMRAVQRFVKAVEELEKLDDQHRHAPDEEPEETE